MKYKILLTGNNNAVIDSLLKMEDKRFEIIRSSIHYEDIYEHLTGCKPDLFLYCLAQEPEEELGRIYYIRELLKDGIPFAVIGSEEACSYFTKNAGAPDDLVLPLTAAAELAMEHIAGCLEGREQLPPSDEKTRRGMIWKKAVPKKHILIVDDDLLTLKMLKEYFRDRYDVATASSGKTALHFLEKKKTDLILLDYDMPDEKGTCVLQRLRANDATKEIPVLFLTGVTAPEKIQAALTLKPQGYLLKPIDFEKLKETVAEYIG